MPDPQAAEPEEETERFLRPFSDWLEEQRGGKLNIELSAALNDLVEKVDATGKSGTISLKLTVKPSGKDSQGSVTVADMLTVKAPESHPEYFYFVDDDKNLTRSNPHQLGYDGQILEVPERHTEVREPRR